MQQRETIPFQTHQDGLKSSLPTVIYFPRDVEEEEYKHTYIPVNCKK